MCDTVSSQWWNEIHYRKYEADYEEIKNAFRVECSACDKWAVWIEGEMVFPPTKQGPVPSSDMPTDVLALYDEARAVLPVSPRSAAALLRTALETLTRGLGSEHRLNDAIGALVKEGRLADEMQKAADLLRLSGNDAAHPGDLRSDDTRERVLALFDFLNLLTDRLVGVPARVQRMYDHLPEGKREQIERRDAPSQDSA